MMKIVVLVVLVCEVVSSPAWSTSWSSPTRPLTQISSISRGKGKVDTTPHFLSDNYIPATMHVLFHLSDQMKYEMRPPGASGTPGAGGGPGAGPTSTTVRPTQPHKPGNYAPIRPAGPPGFYHSQGSDGAWSYGWGKIIGGLTPENIPEPVQRKQQQEVLPADIDLFGAGPFELIHQINTLEDTDTVGDDDVQIERFSINYEDTVNLDFLRQKRVPPTKAFVNVLSLFDLLNKESKELGLNKFNGYSENMLRELQKTSEGTSSDQLKFVLSKVVDKRNTRKDNILKKIKQMLIDLEKPESYINMAIRYIPPLQFSL